MIETAGGTCAIVVWAHVILGLHVAVRFSRRSTGGYEYREVRFPQNEDFNCQIVIYLDTTHSDWADQYQGPLLTPTITLFSPGTRDVLFEMKEDPMGNNISSNFKRPSSLRLQSFRRL
jgi:hypothetical protein